MTVELERQLSKSNRARFGRSTEKRETLKETLPRPPQKGHGPQAQLHLEILDEVDCLDEADKACRSCGGTLTEWAGQFEESKLFDAVERKFFIRKVERQKYRCECGGCVETALGFREAAKPRTSLLMWPSPWRTVTVSTSISPKKAG